MKPHRRSHAALTLMAVVCSMLTRKELYEHLNYTPGQEFKYPEGK